MPYGQNPTPIDLDEKARQQKAAENPLVKYFSGSTVPPAQGRTAPSAAPAPAPAPPPTATNVGGGANTGMAAQQRRPGPTGFTNFSRYQAANRGAAEAMANDYRLRAEDTARKARESLAQLQTRFGEGVSKGTVAQTQEGPDGALSAAEDAAMRANADAMYSGPGGLGDVDGVTDTYEATLAAQNELGALGSDAGLQALVQQRAGGTSGSSKLSAALLGGAGRRGFDALRARFNPETELRDAETKAAGEADKARETSASNARANAELAARRDAQAADQASRDDAARAKEADAARAKADEAAFESRWAAAQQADTIDEINRAFSSFNSIMSPITQVAENTGNRDPIADWGRKTLDPTHGRASGGDRGQKIWWQPQHKEVFRQMDPAQWAELNALPPQAQQGWLEQRRRELLTKAPHQRYDATRGFQTDPHRYL